MNYSFFFLLGSVINKYWTNVGKTIHLPLHGRILNFYLDKCFNLELIELEIWFVKYDLIKIFKSFSSADLFILNEANMIVTFLSKKLVLAKRLP
jgi:hypothetical protein